MHWPPGFNPIRLPSPSVNHPLVEGHYFFTLPKELLDDVVARVGETRFDRELLAVERALSAECGDHSTMIGFRDGVPVHYGLLGRPLHLAASAKEGDDTLAGELGWSLTPERGRAVNSLNDRVERIRQRCRAYAGWLALRPQFLREHDDFLATWDPMPRRVGLDAPTPGKEDPARQTMADYAAFADARDVFLRRWQLTGLAGPYLPDPPRPHWPLAGGVTAVLPDAALGTLFFFPHILPLPPARNY